MISEDSELLDIITKFIYILVILIVFSSLFVMMMVNKNFLNVSKFEKIIKNKDNALLLVRKSDCKKCGSIEKELKKSNVKYFVLNTDNDKRRDIIFKKMNITSSDIEEPSVVYVKDGGVYSILVDIQKINDLNKYLEYNNLTN